MFIAWSYFRFTTQSGPTFRSHTYHEYLYLWYETLFWSCFDFADNYVDKLIGSSKKRVLEQEAADQLKAAGCTARGCAILIKGSFSEGRSLDATYAKWASG